MGGFGLPLPPDKQSIFENILSGLKGLNQVTVPGYHGMFQQPVAQSRITRTPIYNAPNASKWNKGKMGEYHPDTDEIIVRPSSLQNTPYDRQNSPLIAHESTHALFGKAGLHPGAVLATSGIPPEVGWQVDLTGSAFNPHPTSAERRIRESRDANESLAYSIGNPEATDFIESVADQIEDPVLAAQLRRLHYNALATKKLSR